MHKSKDFMLKADRDLLAARFENKRLKWEKARRHGMAFYVSTRWTVLLGGFNCLWGVFLKYETGKPSGDKFLLLLAFDIVISTLIGVWDWHSREKRYREM